MPLARRIQPCLARYYLARCRRKYREMTWITQVAQELSEKGKIYARQLVLFRIPRLLSDSK